VGPGAAYGLVVLEDPSRPGFDETPRPIEARVALQEMLQEDADQSARTQDYCYADPGEDR
jgi:hypothetical protein